MSQLKQNTLIYLLIMLVNVGRDEMCRQHEQESAIFVDARC